MPLKDKVKQIIREEIARNSAQGGVQAYRSGTVGILNADGTCIAIVNGSAITATPLYPVTQGQEIAVAFDKDGKASAIPTRPKTLAPINVLSPYFTGGGALRAATAAVTIVGGVPVDNVLALQQQSDKNTYVWFAPVGSGAFFPLAFSPNGAFLAFQVFIRGTTHSGNFLNTQRYIMVLNLGAKFSGTPSTLGTFIRTLTAPVVMTSQVFDIVDLAQAITGLTVPPGGNQAKVTAISVDNDGTVYVSMTLIAGSSSTKTYEVLYEIDPDPANPITPQPLFEKARIFSSQFSGSGSGSFWTNFGILDGKRQTCVGTISSPTPGVLLVQDLGSFGLGSFPPPYFTQGINSTLFFTQFIRSGTTGVVPFIDDSTTTPNLLKAFVVDFAAGTRDLYTVTVINPPIGLPDPNVVSIAIGGKKPLARILAPIGDPSFGVGLWIGITIDSVAKTMVADYTKPHIIEKSGTGSKKFDFWNTDNLPLTSVFVIDASFASSAEVAYGVLVSSSGF